MKRAARAEGTGRTGRRNPPPARRRGWGPDRGGGGSAGQVRRGAGWRPMVGRVDLTRIVGSVTRAQPDVKGVGAGSAGRSGGNPKVGGGGQGRPRPDGPRTGGSVDGHVGRRATDRLRYRFVRLWTCVPLRPMPACRPAVSAAATARTRHRMRWVRSHSVPSWEGRERRRPRARRSAVLLRPRRRRTPRVPTPWVAAVRAIAPVLPGGQGAWSEDPDGCAARSRGQIGPMWVRPAHPGPQGCLGAGAGAPGHSPLGPARRRARPRRNGVAVHRSLWATTRAAPVGGHHPHPGSGRCGGLAPAGSDARWERSGGAARSVSRVDRGGSGWVGCRTGPGVGRDGRSGLPFHVGAGRQGRGRVGHGSPSPAGGSVATGAGRRACLRPEDRQRGLVPRPCRLVPWNRRPRRDGPAVGAASGAGELGRST